MQTKTVCWVAAAVSAAALVAFVARGQPYINAASGEVYPQLTEGGLEAVAVHPDEYPDNEPIQLDIGNGVIRAVITTDVVVLWGVRGSGGPVPLPVADNGRPMRTQLDAVFDGPIVLSRRSDRNPDTGKMEPSGKPTHIVLLIER